MKGWVGLVGWPIADGLPTPVSCRLSAGQRKLADQRPTFYRCATEQNRHVWRIQQLKSHRSRLRRSQEFQIIYAFFDGTHNLWHHFLVQRSKITMLIIQANSDYTYVIRGRRLWLHVDVSWLLSLKVSHSKLLRRQCVCSIANPLKIIINSKKLLIGCSVHWTCRVGYW